MLFARGAEFPRSHEDDVGNIGKLVERTAVEQIAGDGFDPLRSEFGGQFVIGKSGHGEDLLLDAANRLVVIGLKGLDRRAITAALAAGAV